MYLITIYYIYIITYQIDYSSTSSSSGRTLKHATFWSANSIQPPNYLHTATELPRVASSDGAAGCRIQGAYGRRWVLLEQVVVTRSTASSKVRLAAALLRLGEFIEPQVAQVWRWFDPFFSWDLGGASSKTRKRLLPLIKRYVSCSSSSSSAGPTDADFSQGFFDGQGDGPRNRMENVLKIEVEVIYHTQTIYVWKM